MESEELLGSFNQGAGEGAKKEQKSPLISLEKDLTFYAGSIKEVAIEIMVEGISTHPIFIAHQHTVNIGEMILNKDELNTDWTIQASTLEEFIQKGIIHPDKKEQFLKTYKSVFAVVPQGANFIYFPYPKG
jgi:hypothetical protein